MKSTSKRVLALILTAVLVLAAAGATAISTTEKEELYNTAILQLESWLEQVGQPVLNLEQISETFDSLGNYEMSRAFGYYTKLLIKGIKEEFDYDYNFWTQMLKSNTAFQEYLKSTINSTTIGTVDDLLNYLCGIESQAGGKPEEASMYFSLCLNYYDASMRYEEAETQICEYWYNQGRILMEEGKLEEAVQAYKRANGYLDSQERIDYIQGLIAQAGTAETVTAPPAPAAPEPAAEPEVREPEPAAPSAAAEDEIPDFLSAYPGQSTEMRHKDDESRRYQAYAGPGSDYATGGAFKPSKQRSVTAFFTENDYVFIELKYQTVEPRYLFIQRSAFPSSLRVPDLSDIECVYGRTTAAIVPLWGPGEDYHPFDEFTAANGTELKIFFRKDNYVYAEYNSPSGLVRMWLPMENIAITGGKVPYSRN